MGKYKNKNRVKFFLAEFMPVLKSSILHYCLSPRYLTKYLNLRSTSNFQTRSANKNNLQEFSCRTESFKHSSVPFCVRERNKLDNTIREAESIKQFKSMLKNFFLWLKDHYFRCMTQQVLNCLQDFGYNSVTLMNTNFVIISKAAWDACVIVVMKQKQSLFLALPVFCKRKTKAPWWCLSGRCLN